MYFDGTGDCLQNIGSSDFAFTGDFTVDTWIRTTSTSDIELYGTTNEAAWTADAWHFGYNNGSLTFGINTNTDTQSFTSGTLHDGNWHHVAIIRTGTTIKMFADGIEKGSFTQSGTLGNTTFRIAVGAQDPTCSVSTWNGYIDEFRAIKGTAITPDQIRQAYEYGLRAHQITIDFGATLQPSDLISNSTDYNFSLTATTSGLSATTSGLYLGDKIIIKENLGGTEYSAQGAVNAINTTTGAITVPSWDTGSTFPSGNGYSPNATVFKWQREYFDITGAATTTRNAVTNLTLRPTNGAGGRTVWLDDFRYNTNYLTASSSSAITSGNNRYLQYRAILTSTDTFVSPFLSAFSTLYTSLATMFPSLIGISGGGFLSF